MASRAAVLSPGEGRVDCWGRHTASRSQSHSPTSACLFFSFSPARAPPLRQGQMDTVTVPVLVRPDVPSRRTSGTWSVRLEAAERDSGCSWESSTRLAVGPESRRRTRFAQRHSLGEAFTYFFSHFSHLQKCHLIKMPSLPPVLMGGPGQTVTPVGWHLH